MRGEHWVAVNHHIRCRGSSPHARGALEADRPCPRVRGLIPACAGSTGRPACRAPGVGAHPRMRGEHTPYRSHSGYAEGSSPHARGALLLRDSVVARRGLIPACAGSTGPYQIPLLTKGAHPRMRGEHRDVGEVGQGAAGSSPHARGARRDPHVGLDIAGLIPACAGSTSGVMVGRRGDRAHPRMRGEHIPPEVNGLVLPGSSPHARGALYDRGGRCPPWGLIPACAGSTSRS